MVSKAAKKELDSPAAERIARMLPAVLLLPCILLTSDRVLAAQTLWSQGEQYVRLVHAADAAQPNDHPIAMAEDQLGRALAKLEILGSKGSMWFTDSVAKTTPVFAAAELELLVPQLARALTSAKPDDDITFVVIGMHPGAIAKERQATAARLFYAAGSLNLIFGDLHQPVAVGGDYDVRGVNFEVDRRLHPFQPGERRASHGTSRIAGGPGIGFGGLRDRPRNDWVKLDLAVVGTPPLAPDAVPEPSQVPVPESAKPARKPVPTAAPRAGDNERDRSPRARLRTLQELRNEGLINEEEFQRKRRAIVDEL